MSRKIADMGEVKELNVFFTAVRNDNRVRITHIGLYMALFQFYNLNQFRNPVIITRAAVMEIAKISGNATYHKLMRDLVEFGYVTYMPSYNPSASSQVHILAIITVSV